MKQKKTLEECNFCTITTRLIIITVCDESGFCVLNSNTRSIVGKTVSCIISSDFPA
jgi:hypothetical protein